jgi:hypothetical protein
MHAASNGTGTDPGPFAPVVVFNESLVTAFGFARFSLVGSEPEKFKLAQT